MLQIVIFFIVILMNVTATTEQYDKHSNQILFFLIQKLKIFNAMLHFGDQIFGLEIVETTIFQFEPGFVLLGPYLYFAGERSICKIHKN